MTDRSRGQAHTLEGTAAALVVLLGLFLAVQAPVTTPSTASLSNEALGGELHDGAEGALRAAEGDRALRGTLLYWDEEDDSFHGTGGLYPEGGLPTRLGEFLRGTFGSRGVAYNVNLHYRDSAGERATRRLVFAGHPSGDAVTASRVVTLHDRDRLRDDAGNPTATTVRDASFYAPDVAPDASLYNVVEVEVVVWRG